MKCLHGKANGLSGTEEGAMSGSYTYVDAFQARTVSNGLERPRKAVRTPSPGRQRKLMLLGSCCLTFMQAAAGKRGGSHLLEDETHL